MFNALRTQYREEGEFFFFFFVLDREIIRYVLWTSDMVYYFIKKNLNV